jgi:hypothetical protein
MNLDIFYDFDYYKKIDDLIFIELRQPEFPFEDFDIDPNNLIEGIYDSTAVYNFLKEVNFIYYFDQRYIGIATIDGKDYIIQVDDEVNIYIIGNNEVNWTAVVLAPDDYLDFKYFCSKNYNTSYDDADYDYLLQVQIKNITF